MPVRLIHFGGKKINLSSIRQQVEFLHAEDFLPNAQSFLKELRTILTDCPIGYLYRFLPLFGDWDEFLYSDNDIVALMNWEKLFDFLPGYDLVHADEEYTTKGIYNHDRPEKIQQLFGEHALEEAITAGHFVAKKSDKLITDIEKAIGWCKQNEGIVKKHDQALLHIAILLGNWNVLNLCKPPNDWLSSWAGDYKNSLELIQKINNSKQNPILSHLHFSGRNPEGVMAIDDLIFSHIHEDSRLQNIMKAGAKKYAGYYYIQDKLKRVKRRLRI